MAVPAVVVATAEPVRPPEPVGSAPLAAPVGRYSALPGTPGTNGT
ncbi:hypothetical protein MGAST_02700 [Mycobacterium gastri 'Wayne']|nr:hypothetical protein MGAST_02700 [Mycobacterium gastri 'Wayne']